MHDDESSYSESWCYYEHPLTRCGKADDKKQRIVCKHFHSSNSGDCSHFNKVSCADCDSVAAHFEMWAARIK